MSDSRLEMLEEENARLREEIAFLKREFTGTDLNLPFEWMLTPDEKRVVGALLRNPLARKEAIMAAIYDGGRDEAGPKIVDVRICKIRRKLKPFNVSIRTVWGVGFVIDEPLRSDLRRQFDPTFKPREARAA